MRLPLLIVSAANAEFHLAGLMRNGNLFPTLSLMMLSVGLLIVGMLMGWVEMSFMGWVLKCGVFGWIKMGCIS